VAAAIATHREATKPKVAIRTDRDILEEVLTTIRNISRDNRNPRPAPAVNFRSGAGGYPNSSQRQIVLLLEKFVESVIIADHEAQVLVSAINDAIANIERNERLVPAYKEAIGNDLRKLSDRVREVSVRVEISEPDSSSDQ
jgi:hypothetical protein